MPTTSQPSRLEQQLEPFAQGLVIFDEDEAKAASGCSQLCAKSARYQSRARARGFVAASKVGSAVAKDTEKLIRQLSLISYLMAERRPVTATEIRRDVEGYSDMTEDAFARRFYADRAELDALGIHLRVDKPADGFSEQENYSLAPEAFHLPAIAFSDAERAALQTALTLLDGEFAYAEPLRLALQQITWGRPSPLGTDSRQTIGLGITASAGGSELSGRLAKVDTAIYRRKRIEFEYYTMQSRRDRAAQGRPVPPAVRGRPVVPRRLLARARRRARVPALAHPRQGRLLDQGRARLPAPGRLRPARLREPHPVAARRPGRHRRGLGVREDRLVRRAPVRRLRHDARRRRRRAHLPHRLRDPAPARRPGRCASATRRASAARPSSSRSRARGWTRSSSATAASRSPRSPTARRPSAAVRRGRERRALARRRGRRSGPSASRGSSRSPPC